MCIFSTQVSLCIKNLIFIIRYSLIHILLVDDKNQSYGAKSIIVLGLLISQLAVLLLPIDVANNGGDATCSQSSSGTTCAGIDMKLFWIVIFLIIIGMLLIVIPFATFYYEADDGLLTGERRSKFCSALKYEICIIIGAAAVLLSAYFTSSKTNIDIAEYNCNLNHLVYYTITPPVGENPTAFIDQLYEVNTYLTKSSSYLTFHVTFPIYIIALMSWVGWWFFAFFGGFGMASIPFDFIQAFVLRPRVLAPDELAAAQLNIQQRSIELVEISTLLKRERLEFKRTATLASAKRLRWARDQVEVNRLNNMVFNLESDLEQFRACKVASHEYNSLIPFVKLLLGMFTLIMSLVWEVHIILYTLISPPVSNFLSDAFIWFDSWFPMFGEIMYAVFALYLVFAVIKGCFKLSVRIMCVKLHPMKVGGTYISSFLFNVGVIMLCTIPIVQFCSTAFASYIRFTDIFVIFGVQIKYLAFFKLFFEKNVFIWILFLFCPISLIYLAFKPVDRPASPEEFKELLQRRQAGVT